MIFKSYRTAYILFFAAGCVFFLITMLSFFACFNNDAKKSFDNNIKTDEFSGELSSITSLNDFKNKIRQKVIERNISGIDIPILIDDYVRNKFYHTTLFYKPCENYILFFLDVIFPEYFFRVVLNSDDIIKSNFAACNQQVIVFLDIVKEYGFEYGVVGFNAINFEHLAGAVKFDGKWYFFDSNLEPKYDRSNPKIFDAVVASDKNTLHSMYKHAINRNLISLDNLKQKSISLKEISVLPGATGRSIQSITAYISKYIWIIFLLIGFIFLYFEKKNK